MNELLAVHAFGDVPAEVLSDARARLTEAARGGDVRVSVQKVKLTEPACGPARAQVNAEVGGRPVRVQEAAALGDVAGRLADALRRRVAEAAGPWSPRPWRQEAPPPDVVPGPAGGRGDIVRVKRPALTRCSPDEAARTMDAMDYDIHLFTCAATGSDAVLYRVGPTGYRLARTVAAAPPGDATAPLTLSPYAAPRLTEQGAVARLEDADLPYLFFAHRESGRGHVLYRRFDGRLGLIAGAS